MTEGATRDSSLAGLEPGSSELVDQLDYVIVTNFDEKADMQVEGI